MAEKKKPSAAQEFKEMLASAESRIDFKIDAAKLELSEQIYNAMEECGVTEAELARRLDVSRAYVNKVLKGTANLTIESLVKIGAAIGRDLNVKFRKTAKTRVFRLGDSGLRRISGREKVEVRNDSGRSNQN